MFHRVFNRTAFQCAADALAILVALSLPWSTSATSIVTALWFVAVLPTLDVASVRRTVTTPAGGLALALFALAAVGMLWGEAPVDERLGGFRVFLRLLAIPLLLIQFQRSGRGMWIAGGFLVSCTALVAYSWALTIFPSLPRGSPVPGVPVKDYVVQSGEFVICAFGLSHLAFTSWQQQRRRLAIAFGILALAFLANIGFVATGRTSVVVFIVLLAVFGMQRLRWKGALAVFVGGVALVAATWATSPYLRSRVGGVAVEIQQYETKNAETSSGYRLEFWKKSVGFIATAPIFGHGTGSTEEMFRRARGGGTGISAAVTANPHNQILLIAVELGLVGVAFLLAMWLAHGLLFVAPGLAAWLGMGIVVQNVVSSLFNAQLFYFAPGWTYVFGVGVFGGMVLAQRAKDQPAGRESGGGRGWGGVKPMA
jgi:O-antigen ligase